MAISHRPNTAPVYEAARRWKDAALSADGSLFTPGVPVWSSTTAEDLHRLFNMQPDESSSSFLEKFQRQLAAASPLTVQLAAEIFYIHLVVANDLRGTTKRSLVEKVLKFSPEPVGLPADLADTLDTGLGATGQAFKMYRPHQLWLLVDFICAWKGLPDGRRQELLSDPWAFKEWLTAIPMTSAYAQRNALLHLVHPDTFEPIVSREHKGKIVAAFRDRASAPDGDVDRALLDIRTSLAAEYGETFDFYRDPVVQQWLQAPKTKDDTDLPVARHAWFVRGANVNGHNLIATWLAEGFCSIGWYELGEVPADLDRKELRRRVAEAYPDEPSQAQANYAGILHRFLTQMRDGDVVVTVDGDDVYLGVIDSPPYWVESDIIEASRRREVTWSNPHDPVHRAQLPGRVFAKLRTLLTLTDLTDVLVDLEALLDRKEIVVEEAEPFDLRLPRATKELAADLHLPLAWLDGVIDDLEAKRQLIFYGPPGTSKTYVARALADHLVAQPSNAMLVQFHPSYAYEDFFEGFRPRPASEGTISFELVPGPLRRLAAAAHADPKTPYVLVIDEINRANLAKVFGELYFLLEYREDAVTLQYSPDGTFSLSRNLYVIGTMNTADRSIARIDAAMRRRFWFVEFFPDRHPIDGLLRQWLIDHDRPTGPADLLDALNDRIGDPDFAVGPSYLMTERSSTPEGLRSIWGRAILPLLEEHYYGSAVDVGARFGLDALVASSQPADGEPADEADGITGEGDGEGLS